MRVTIKAKLAAAFALVLLFLGTSAYIGVSGLQTVNGQLAALVGGPARQLELVAWLAVPLDLAGARPQPDDRCHR